MNIILFNTSIGSLLKDTANYLNDLCNTLTIFKKSKDILLWWRPHPLLLPTLRSMRKDLMEEYIEIVETYEKEGWGIYDNTIDMHRAITWSDAYYGDESSLVYLYCATGKPFALTSELLDIPNLTETATDFSNIMQWQIRNMQTYKGANIGNWNVCIWWHYFSSDRNREKRNIWNYFRIPLQIVMAHWAKKHKNIEEIKYRRDGNPYFKY